MVLPGLQNQKGGATGHTTILAHIMCSGQDKQHKAPAIGIWGISSYVNVLSLKIISHGICVCMATEYARARAVLPWVHTHGTSFWIQCCGVREVRISSFIHCRISMWMRLHDADVVSSDRKPKPLVSPGCRTYLFYRLASSCSFFLSPAPHCVIHDDSLNVFITRVTRAERCLCV